MPLRSDAVLGAGRRRDLAESQVSRSMDHKYFRTREYQKERERQRQENGEKDDAYVYNPQDYTFESIIRIFITKMNGGRLSLFL